MTPVNILDQTKKHGISVLLLFALFWLNQRLSKVEEKYAMVEMKLYDCLEDQIKTSNSAKKEIKRDYLYAILPKEENHGKLKRKMAIKNA